MENTKIEWCDATFNSWFGCSRVSAGCVNCYAERQAKRNPAVLGEWGTGKRVIASESYWQQPLRWNRKAEKAGRRYRVFCGSMMDIFEDRPELEEPRSRLFQLIKSTPNLDWLCLTKRPGTFFKHVRLTIEALDKFETSYIIALREWMIRWINGDPPINVWIGVSVENQETADERIPLLLQIPAAVRFLSCEPLLSSLGLLKYLELSSGVKNERSRNSFLSENSSRCIQCRRYRRDLEASENGGRFTPSGSGIREGFTGQFEDKGRNEWIKIFNNLVHHDESHATQGVCTQDSVDDSQSIRHSSRDGSQSQGREQEKQSPIESRNSHQITECDPQLSGTPAKEEGAIWRKQCNVQAHEGTGCTNQGVVPPEGTYSIEDCEDVRDRAGNCLCNSHKEKLVGSHNRSDRAISLVIVGGESGPKARPMHPAWARSIRDQCVAAGVPFFFKQWGEWMPGAIGGGCNNYYRVMYPDGRLELDTGTAYRDVMHAPYESSHGAHIMSRVGKRVAGRMLDGRTWDEMPA